MTRSLSIHRILVRLAPAVLATGLVLAVTPDPASGYYGGYYGGGHYGGGHFGGRHFGGGHFGGRHGFGFGGHHGGHLGYGYRSYSYGGHYGGHLGYGYRSYSYGGHYGGHRGYGYRPYSYGGHYGGHRGYGYRPYAYGGYYGGSPRYSYAYSYRGEPEAQSSSSGTHPYTSPDTTANAPSGSGVSEGWARLADGRYGQALAVFADEASSHPTEGRPKVGYALAAAGSGDLRRGVWAMRRALRIDPDAIHYVAVGESLRPRLEHLVTRYHEYSAAAGHATESAFMLASLHYLLGDPASARTAIDLAAADGTSSTANLKRLIDEQLADEPQQRGADYPAVAGPQDAEGG